MDKILEQLKNDVDFLQLKEKSITSIFIGGGTPSSVDARLYRDFFDFIYPYLTKNVEITTEANPNSANLEWLEIMKDLGVNRVSFGVQSFDDKKLKFLGRNHSKNEAINAVLNAHKTKFKNISLDIIYETMLDSKKLLSEDIKTASNLPINHISAYSLTIEKNTLFYKMPKAKKESITLSKYLFNTLNDFGFYAYEISNFSRNYKCKHNIGYWKHKKYIGIGSSAVSFDGKNRVYTQLDPKKYIQNPNSKRYESITNEDMILEKIFLGFRSFVGIKESILPLKMKKNVDILLKCGKLILRNGRLYNPNFLLADEIALFITS
jgi:oxygen-independent coproporphyrinogen-3 oxidase